MAERSGANRDAFTAAEHGTANVVMVLLRLHNLYVLPKYEKVAAAEFISQALESLGIWLTKSNEALSSSLASGKYASISLAPDLQIPIWSLYHELYSHLEQCIFINAVLKYLLTENKKQPIVDHKRLNLDVKALQSECTNLSGNVSRAASAVRDKLRDPTFLQRLTKAALGHSEEGADEDPIAKGLRRMGDQSEMRDICQSLKNSWIDGLEGVIRTKLA